MTMVMAEPPPRADLRLADRLAAHLGFWSTVMLLHVMPLRGIFAIVRALHRASPQPADITSAERWRVATIRAARHYPGRAACLEISLATTLTAAARRRHVWWCLGARFAPSEYHAWVETLDTKVGELTETDRPLHPAVRL